MCNWAAGGRREGPRRRATRPRALAIAIAARAVRSFVRPNLLKVDERARARCSRRTSWRHQVGGAETIAPLPAALPSGGAHRLLRFI